MFYGVADTATGVPGFGTSPVYRLWNQRADLTTATTRPTRHQAAMRVKNYLAEGTWPTWRSLCI